MSDDLNGFLSGAAREALDVNGQGTDAMWARLNWCAGIFSTLARTLPTSDPYAPVQWYPVPEQVGTALVTEADEAAVIRCRFPACVAIGAGGDGEPCARVPECFEPRTEGELRHWGSATGTEPVPVPTDPVLVVPCETHERHDLAGIDAVRVIVALSAEAPIVERDVCPLVALTWARESETYREHVDARMAGVGWDVDGES